MDNHPPDLSLSLPERPSVTEALMRLEELTDRLRKQGQLLAASTIITVAGSIALAFYRVFAVLYVVGLITVVVIVASALQALLLSVFFESRRKEGDVLFKEISDELQWYVRFGHDEKSAPTSSAPEHRPDLDARLALRSFAQTSDLPLIPGAFGPLLYAAINISSVAFAAVSLLPFFSRSLPR